MTQYEFVSRYPPGSEPNVATMCLGQCEGLGTYPQNRGDLNITVAELALWTEAHNRPGAHDIEGGACDGWHFIRCPDCHGTGKRPETPAVERLVYAVMPTPLPRWRRTVSRLFPREFCDAPDLRDARDCVITRTRARLSWHGRLRVLVSGRLLIETKTATENMVGATKTAGAVSVLPPEWLDREGE